MRQSVGELDIADALEELYSAYNRREYVHPDPLEFLYGYDDPADREIVALIASSLAYGRVAQILANVSRVLERMPSPRRFIERASAQSLGEKFRDIKHRFTTGDEIAGLFFGVKRAVKKYGSLHACFVKGICDTGETVVSALASFARELRGEAGGSCGTLIPDPTGGSALKRLNLFLRWMVRKDAVDPGWWDSISASKLVVPLDTHMHKIGLALGFTRRAQADMKTALEITAAFGKIRPDDPVRYDFALTRLGIRNDLDKKAFFARCGAGAK